jgi:AcrR family transcriptional regulator
VPKVSEAHKAGVRDGLVEAAARVMARGGPSAATTRAVLEEAGVSAGTLYNYFPSKAELFAAVGEYLLFSEWQQVVGALDPDLPDGGLREVVESAVLNRIGDPASQAAGIQLRTRMPADDIERDALRRYNRALVDTASPAAIGGQRLGHLDPDLDVEALVELLDMIGDAIVIRDVQVSWATSHARVTDVIRHLLDTSIYRHGPMPAAGSSPAELSGASATSPKAASTSKSTVDSTATSASTSTSQEHQP